MYKTITTYDKNGDWNHKYVIDKEDDKYYYFIDGFQGDELRLDKELEILQYNGNNNSWITFKNWLDVKEKPTFKVEFKMVNEDIEDMQERIILKSYERKYYHIKFESEKLREVMLKLTEKINELSDELDIVGEMFENSLKFNEQ